MYPDGWTIGSYGRSPKNWFLLRYLNGRVVEYHKDRKGNIIRYTRAGAGRKLQALLA